jgi:uncharacterized protein (DUF885 family)
VTTFAGWFESFLAEHLRLDPLSATHVGLHDHDGRWPDWSAAGRTARRAFVGRSLDELDALHAAGLTRDEGIDRDVVRGVLEAEAWETDELHEDTWNPLVWVYALGDGIFPLLAREFAPLAVRLGSIEGRLLAMPGVVDAAVEALGSVPGLPVARLHAEMALRDLAGVGELAGEALATAEAAAPTDPDVAAAVPALRSAVETARAALSRLEAHLRDVIGPASDADGRRGRERFEHKLRHTLASATPSADDILAAAEHEYRAVRAEMIRLARDLWPTWRAGTPLPDAASHGSPEGAEQAIVRDVLDAISADHPAAEDLLEACRTELAGIEAFCRERDLIGLADEPLEIQWTPLFLRSFGGAMLSSPGPLDRGQKAFFSITPVPEEWPDDQRESYLREDNTRQLRLLTIHEAVPGHYLQGVYANRSGSFARSVFGSGLYAEGWAVYVTQVMIDAGYEADDPALALVHWKFYLRAAINAILDHRIHVDGIGEAEAMALMVEGGFQEEAEARKKYDRARLTSAQLSTYFVGSMEFWAIERDVRRRLATDAGDPRGAAAVVERDLPGGYGETPGFTYRPYLEDLLSHGEPPTSILRRVVLGEP